MYMKRRKVKQQPIIILVVFTLLFVIGIVGFNLYKHYTSMEYKLGKLGYNEKEISILVKKDTKTVDKALKKYDEHLISLTNEKYFMWKN